jgi:hypothetical protein
LLLATHTGVSADTVGVRVEEWNKIDISGVAGKFGNMLTGGKDGTTQTVVINASASRQAVATSKLVVVTDLDLGAVFTINKGSCTDVITFDQLREQWEKMTEEGNPFEAMKSGRQPDGSGEAPKMTADVNTKVIGPKEIAGIAGTEMQIEIVIHEEGMTIDESGGVIVDATTVHGKTDALIKRAEFNLKYAEILGEAIGAREQLEELKNAFLSNPAIEQGMAEFKKANISEDNTVLASDTKIRMVPDPRMPPPDDGSEGSDPSASPASATKGAFKSIGKMFGRKKKNQEEEPAQQTDAPVEPGGPRQVLGVQQQIRTVDQGGAELLELPDNCIKKLKKITG